MATLRLRDASRKMQATAPAPVVEFRNVSYRVAGTLVLAKRNLQVRFGKTVVLLGRSGLLATNVPSRFRAASNLRSRGSLPAQAKTRLPWTGHPLVRILGFVSILLDP